MQSIKSPIWTADVLVRQKNKGAHHSSSVKNVTTAVFFCGCLTKI